MKYVQKELSIGICVENQLAASPALVLLCVNAMFILKDKLLCLHFRLEDKAGSEKNTCTFLLTKQNKI